MKSSLDFLITEFSLLILKILPYDKEAYDQIEHEISDLHENYLNNFMMK